MNKFRKWWLLLAIALVPLSARADGLLSNKFSTAVVGTTIDTIGTAISFHKMTWNVSGTVTVCTVALDTSADGITWSAGGAIVGQTCTTNGASTVANVTANYVRMNMTAFTATAGSSVTVTWTGGVNAAGSGGITGVLATNQIAFGTAGNTVGGSNLFTFTLATPNKSTAILNASPCPLSQISQVLLCTDGTYPTSTPQLEIVGGNNGIINSFAEICLSPSQGTGNTGTTRATTSCWGELADPGNSGLGGLSFKAPGVTGGALQWQGSGSATPGAIELGVFGNANPNAVTEFEILPDAGIEMFAPNDFNFLTFRPQDASTALAEIGMAFGTNNAQFLAVNNGQTNFLDLDFNVDTGIADLFTGVGIVAMSWDASQNTIFKAGLFPASGHLLISSTAPTVSSGFGTGASVTANNGPAAFRVSVGTSNTGTGVIGLPTATTGWNCYATNITTKNTNQATVLQTASTTASATFQNYTDVMGTHAMTDNDVLAVSCFAY